MAQTPVWASLRLYVNESLLSLTDTYSCRTVGQRVQVDPLYVSQGGTGYARSSPPRRRRC